MSDTSGTFQVSAEKAREMRDEALALRDQFDGFIDRLDLLLRRSDEKNARG